MKLMGENPFLKKEVNLLSMNTWKGAALFAVFAAVVMVMYRMITPRADRIGGEAEGLIGRYTGAGQ